MHRLLFAAILSLGALFAGNAQAAITYPACKTANASDGVPGTTPSRECAYASVRAYLEYYSTWRGGTPYTMCGPYPKADTSAYYDSVEGWTQSASHGGNCPVDRSDQTTETYPVGVLCNDPAMQWDDATGTCKLAGPTDEECLALNSQEGFFNVGPISRAWSSSCLANGCRFEAVDQVSTSVVNGYAITSGIFEWTGACSPGTNAPLADEATPTTSQECAPASGGQTFCLKGTGEHCYTASTGKQICWTAGETGTKTTDNVAQVRAGGTTPPAAPVPPEGETFTQGPSTTATTTTGGVTITTTTTNYITNNGTDAGDTDSGEPDDGSAPNDAGDESGVGGGSCSAGYLCSGDAVQCAILEEAHNARCSRESLATQLNDAADDYGYTAEPSTAFGTGNLGATVLDTTGWLPGGETCPVENIPELPGLDLVSAVCPGASVWATYIYLMALIHCAHILGRAASGAA